jgi:hypothetical protein
MKDLEHHFNWGKDHPMWKTCVSLGPFTNSLGDKFDLGVCPKGVDGCLYDSLAVVYGPEPENYISGWHPSCEGYASPQADYPEGRRDYDVQRETWKRWEFYKHEGRA